MEQILNFDPNTPFNVALLDQVVNCMYQGNQSEIQAAQRTLTEFQKHPSAWTRVSLILEQSSSSNTKFFALQILQEAIRYRWKVLPEQQRQGIKNYIVKTIIEKSSDSKTLHAERVLVGKLNEVLVQIVKNEWPQQWRNFLPEIVAASKTSESICENNMHILQLLSEEIFDFASGKLTQQKVKELSATFTQEFAQIYELCEFILTQASKPSLIRATLKTLQRFLTWIPAGYIFQTGMIEALVTKFFPVREFRNATLRCLVEIVGISDIPQEYSAKVEQLFLHLIRRLVEILPLSTNISGAYNSADDYDQKFIQILGLLLSTLFKSHLKQLEKNAQFTGDIITAHRYLVEISKCDEPEMFKTCLEYWHFLAEDLYFEERASQQQRQHSLGGSALDQKPMFFAETPASMRKATYEREIMPQVRLVMISKMAKPEEVIIVEDENGDIVKEHMKDVDAIQLYKTMRDTLIYLTHLNYTNTEQIMLEKLARQVDQTEWSWHNLNTLCWAIGSIRGAMRVKDEKKFLVTVIRDLLGLVELKRGKDNKAVVASNIMYIVGQYPRFLMDHWKFLRTVVNKLFEFMHEMFEGVREMACETFLKISKDTKRKFVEPQDGERPYVEDILQNLPEHISDLEQSHIHIFYEAVGHMVSIAQTGYRETLLSKLMELPNATWNSIMQTAATHADVLKDYETMRQLVNLLKTNVSVAVSVGPVYVLQMKEIFNNMLSVYKAYSQLISEEVATHGPIATKHSHVRTMRTVKKETLKLVEVFIVNTDDSALILRHFASPLLAAILGDYKTSVPDAKDPGVLTLLAVLLDKLRDELLAPTAAEVTGMDIPKVVLENVLECTLPMITKNFEDYPEHRMNLFTLLRSINKNCFQAFFRIPPQGFKLVLDSVLWAVRHNDRKSYKTGLHILEEMLGNIDQLGNPQIINGFYKTYYIRLMNDVMYVLTDTLHKAGFKLQASILFYMFRIVREKRITEPIFDTTQHPQLQSNEEYVRQYMNTLIGNSFPNLAKQQVSSFVSGLFELTTDLERFKLHLRDFLVIQREFSDQDNTELFKEEAKKQEMERQARLATVPGLLAPAPSGSSSPSSDAAIGGGGGAQ